MKLGCEILVVGLIVTWQEHIASPFRCLCYRIGLDGFKLFPSIQTQQLRKVTLIINTSL